MVERLRNFGNEVINRTFRNTMRKEVSLKLHKITSKYALRLEVELRFLEQMKHRSSTYYIPLLFVEINLKRQITD
jgi:hypothetical protein